MTLVRASAVAGMVLSLATAVQAGQQGQAHCVGGSDPDQQIRACSQLIEQAGQADRFLAVAYFDRAVAYDHKGDRAHALSDYGDAIRRDPSLASAYYNRGRARVEFGDLDGAVADYSDAIRL